MSVSDSVWHPVSLVMGNGAKEASRAVGLIKWKVTMSKSGGHPVVYDSADQGWDIDCASLLVPASVKGLGL